MPSKLTSRLRLDKRTLNFIGFNPTGDFGPFTAYTTRTHRKVIFARAPPLSPPTAEQTTCRDRFRTIAIAWHALTEFKRAAWRRAARTASLSITGYDLYTWWNFTGDDAAIYTIERQTDEKLIP